MKKVLTILLLCLSGYLNISSTKFKKFVSAVYYVSNTTTGASDANNGTSPTTPWFSLAKVQAMQSSFAAGDKILFKRGDVFQGNLYITKSGTSSAQITYGAYGEGEKPVWTGLKSITGWTSSGNVYTSSNDIDAQDSVGIVLINGQIAQKGRWPNLVGRDFFGSKWVSSASDDNNGSTVKTNGGLDYEEASFTSLTDDDWGSLTNKPSGINDNTDWDGAEIVIRQTKWVIRKGRISTQDHPTTASTVYNYTIKNEIGGLSSGFQWEALGYFIQDHPKTLDKEGEWYYNPTTNRLSVYMATAAGKTVQMATYSKLVDVTNDSYITFDNIIIEGANTHGIFSETGSTKIIINNCDFRYIGGDAIRTRASHPSWSIEDNDFLDIGSVAISLRGGGTNVDILNNTITNVGMVAGMMTDETAKGIYTESQGDVMYNDILNSGYNGIHFEATDNLRVAYNRIRNFGMTVDDCGGIYTVARDSDPVFTNVVVENNIIDGGYGNNSGSKSYLYGGNGIYADNDSKYITYNNNFVNNTFVGIYLHRGTHINVTNNTFVFSDLKGKGFFIDNTSSSNVMTGLVITGNTYVCTHNGPPRGSEGGAGLMVITKQSGTNWGTMNNNYYIKPMGTANSKIIRVDGADYKPATLAEWKADADNNFDLNSVGSPYFFPNSNTNTTDPNSAINVLINPNNSPTTFSLGNFGYTSTKNVVSNGGNITIPAYSGQVLLKNGFVITSGNTPPTVSLTAPNAGEVFESGTPITISATASDNGSIANVAFYANGELVEVDNTSPYTCTFEPLGLGSFYITAIATDNSGDNTTSSPRTILINTPYVPLEHNSFKFNKLRYRIIKPK